MAKLSFAVSAVLLLVFFLVVSVLDAAAPVPKLCEKASKTFSGKCNNKKCDTQCHGWEKAKHGACHKREGKDACFCYFDCSKGGGSPPGKAPAAPKAPPAAGGSPPPAAGGSPPPPAGGDSPPPPADGGSPPPADGGSPPPADGGSPPPADGGSPPPSS